MTIHYALSFLLLAFTALSSLRLPKWWVKMWDAGRLQLTVFLTILLVVGLFTLDFTNYFPIIITALLSTAVIYHLYIIFPFTPFHKTEIPSTQSNSNSLSMLTCNVRMSNENTKNLLKLIQEKNPDVILLTETNQWWIDKMESLNTAYAYAILQPQENTYGIALYSKYPLENGQVKFLVEKEIPSIHTNIKVKDKVVQFIGLHPRPPAPWTNEENKDIELIKVAALTNHNLHPTVVTGDLNDVCWSQITASFKAISGLKDPRVGRGFFNTYNANIPFFRYPVDHFFVSDHFQLRTIKKLSHVGSDHFPVLLEVNLSSGSSYHK